MSDSRFLSLVHWDLLWLGPGVSWVSEPRIFVALLPHYHTTTIHTHFQTQKLHYKTKEYSGRTVLPSCS
jgi:hypothetical protein